MATQEAEPRAAITGSMAMRLIQHCCTQGLPVYALGFGLIYAGALLHKDVPNRARREAGRSSYDPKGESRREVRPVPSEWEPVDLLQGPLSTVATETTKVTEARGGSALF